MLLPVFKIWDVLHLFARRLRLWGGIVCEIFSIIKSDWSFLQGWLEEMAGHMSIENCQQSTQKNIFLLSLQIIRRVDWRNSKHPKKATNAVKKLALKFNDRHLKAEWFNDNFRDNFITSTKKRWWGTTMCAIGFTIATSIRMYLARGQFIKVES
jgi:hypothetical protein